MTELLEGRLDAASRIVILGVGSELRADDAAGLLVAEKLEKSCAENTKILVLRGATAPENLTGPIIAFKPSHLVIVDCAEMDEEPGTVRLFPADKIGGVSSSTHTLPLKIVIDYINKGHPCETLVVGIQPKSVAFDGKQSAEVLQAVDSVAAAITEAVRRLAT